MRNLHTILRCKKSIKNVHVYFNEPRCTQMFFFRLKSAYVLSISVMHTPLKLACSTVGAKTPQVLLSQGWQAVYANHTTKSYSGHHEKHFSILFSLNPASHEKDNWNVNVSFQTLAHRKRNWNEPLNKLLKFTSCFKLLSILTNMSIYMQIIKEFQPDSVNHDVDGILSSTQLFHRPY